MEYSLTQYISNSPTQVFKPAVGQRVNYSANTGIASLSTGDSSLTSPTNKSLVITGSSNGTLVQTLTIQATGNTTRGMIRLFLLWAETNIKLISEVPIPERTISTSSGIDKAFSKTLQINFMLGSGYSIYATTQNSETFKVIAEGLVTTFP